MTTRPFPLLLSLVLFACGGQTSETLSQRSFGTSAGSIGASSSGGDASSACSYPAKATTVTGASPAGCSPGPASQICQVSNGATILLDGAVANGTETCTSECGASDYELTCTSGASGEPNAIPDPDPSLGCAAIPVPTPSNVLFYCCPCGG